MVFFSINIRIIIKLIMSFSNKDLDKLKKLISKENKSKMSHHKNNINFENSTDSKNTANKISDPENLFYSIIDNDRDINDIDNSLKSLRYEEDQSRSFQNSDIISEKINKSSKYKNKYLSTEDILYDEFNYLLDE